MRSMACCASPRAIIWVNTRRCWSRKKSSGLRFSMAALRALLSRMTAPSTERSASRLLGRGFSRVESEGIVFRFIFAYSNTDPFGAQDDGARRIDSNFQVARTIVWARPNPCLQRERIVMGRVAGVNWCGCEFCDEAVEKKLFERGS